MTNVAADKACCVPATTCCEALLGGWLDRKVSAQLASGFGALANPVRLQMLSFIAHAPGGEASASKLRAGVCRSQPTVSHHLRILHDAGLVTRERRGKRVFYRLNTQRVAELVDFGTTSIENVEGLSASIPRERRLHR